MARAEATTSHRIGRAMAWTVASRAGRFLIGLGTSVLVVRGLGERDYGVLSVVRSILMFAVLLAGLGTGQALLKFLPVLRVARAGDAARRLMQRVLAVHVATWVGFVLLVWVLRGPLEDAFHVGGFGTVIAAAVALALFEILFTVAAQVLNAGYDTARLAMASLASHVVYALVLLWVLPRGYGVTGVVVAGAIGNAVACVLIAGSLRRATDYGDGEAADAPDTARLWRYAAPFAAIGVLNLVVWRQSETLLLAHFRSAEEAGYFDLAYRLPQTALEFVPGTVWPLVMAGMSESFARDPSRLRAVIVRYYRLLFVLCAPLCTLGAVLGGRAVHVLFDDAMAAAAVPTQLFFLIFTVSFLSTPLSMALYVLERTHVNLLIYLALAVINVGLDLLLIPRWGVTGAMIPVAIAIALQPLLYYGAVRRRIPGVTIPLGFVARCFAASLPALLALPVLAFVGGAAGLALGGVVAVTGVLFGCRVLRLLAPEELEVLSAVPVPLAQRLARFLSGPQRS